MAVATLDLVTPATAPGAPAEDVAPMPPLPTGTTSVQLRDGTVVTLRPLAAGERGPVLHVFDRMSLESRRMRFLAAVPYLSEQMLRLLTDVDHVRHGAWVAETDDGPIAVARWIRLREEPDIAEIALSVVDEWQGRGLGRLLVNVLGVAAEGAGIAGLAWTIDVENRRALRLAGEHGRSRRVSGGVVEARTTLPPTDGVDVAAVRRLSRLAAFARLAGAAAA